MNFKALAFDLVKTTTADQLILSGLFVEGDKNKPVILHIHGFQGDFFTNGFVSAIAESSREHKNGFLTVQTRGMANEYLLNTTDKKWKKMGSHFEVLEDAHKDIDAWIEFLVRRGYTDIILQGHSLGTMKALRYLFEGSYVSHVKKVVLLAPFDIMYLLEDATNGKWPEYLEIARQKVAEGKGEEMIPAHYLDVPASYQTFVSHHEQSELQKMFAFHEKNYNFPLLNKIDVPVKVLVGTKDEYFHPANKENPQEAMEILRKNLKNFSGKLFEGAGHGFDGFEELVASEVTSFINS